MLPAGDAIIVLNSASQKNIVSITKTTPDVRSDESTSNMLGAVNDPYFGVISSGFATQFVLSEIAPNFGTNAICDSVVFFFPFSGEQFGKITSPEGEIKFSVYELSSSILKDDGYYQNTSIGNYIQTADSLRSFSVLPEDFIVSVLKPENPGGIKLKLPASFGQKILDNPGNLLTNAEFVNFFKGLALVPDTSFLQTGKGCILNFDLVNSSLKSKISIHFHNDAQPVLTYDLQVTPDCARFNFLTNNYAAFPEITEQLSDTTLGNSQVFLKSMYLQPVIYFPFLETWKDSMPLSINRAQLVVKVNDLENSSFSQPQRIVLFTYNPDGNFQEIADYRLGETFYGGIYNSVAGEYRFNISVYLQEILSGKRTDKGLWLRPFNESSSVKRVSLKGGNMMSVELIYSKN